MAKVTIPTITSGFASTTAYNSAFDTIEAELNNNVLYRNNPSGEPNQMANDLDMNGHRILNALAQSGDGFIWEGVWITSTPYDLNNLVSNGGKSYICTEAHTSGTFGTDLGAGKWELLADQGAAGAGTGDMLKSENLFGLGDYAIARANLGLSNLATTTATAAGLAILDDASAPAQLATLGATISGTTAKTGAYTVVAADRGKLIDCTSGTWILSLTAAATLGDGFAVAVRNSGAGVITLDPNSTETVDGATTVDLAAGESCLVVCNGTAFKTVGSSVPSGLLLYGQAFSQATVGAWSTTVPAGARHAVIEVYGGGGGGASCSTYYGGGGSGGAGGYSLESFSVTSGQTLSGVIGGGGAAGSGQDGYQCGISGAAGGATTCTQSGQTASGGGGGPASCGSDQSGNFGAGGTASGGDTNTTGAGSAGGPGNHSGVYGAPGTAGLGGWVSVVYTT